MGRSASIRALLMLGILCVAGTTANAGEMYFTPAVVYTDDDKNRQVDDTVGGGQISFGWVLTDRVSIEGMGGYSRLSGVNDLKIWDASLNVLLSLSPDSRLSPYVIGGVGMTNTDSKVMDTENSAVGTLGIGVMYRFGDSPVSLRLEHRLRSELDNTLTNDDRITSLGLQFAFGREKPMPPPPVERDGDADDDGVPDSRDACPDTPAGQRVDARGCPRDSDGDGVIDDQDQCPDTVAGVSVDARGCELDSDSDSVVDRRDECPNTRAGARVDVKGCEIREVINLPGVNFQTNSDRLLPGAEQVLADAAATLRMNRDLVVEVAGHTDSDGSAAYNEGLSERRAITVHDYLINNGANPANLTVRGYGEAQPVADNATAQGKARNRRVELRILNKPRP
ncbi:MAG: OmpA family protein [Gammaproteobacteria bacterium]|nr:OmpA family protein [Gammaproteobacteria bacterium]MDH3374673.1 OmpA family protein [Gammaproteobacteria bacterium]MDH3410152.1 OmpA family protein [Gammaproteobacteria bacterium]MDH3552878.1 OmpA family protein [Gammaproteobacteria bacterium]